MCRRPGRAGAPLAHLPSARIYHADQTAHIRRRLRTETIRYSAGLLAAILLAVINGVLTARFDGRHATLTAAVWWADAILIVISCSASP